MQATVLFGIHYHISIPSKVMNSEKQSLIDDGAAKHACSNILGAEGTSIKSSDDIPKKEINRLAHFLELIGVGKAQYLPWIAGFFIGHADYRTSFNINHNTLSQMSLGFVRTI